MDTNPHGFPAERFIRRLGETLSFADAANRPGWMHSHCERMASQREAIYLGWCSVPLLMLAFILAVCTNVHAAETKSTWWKGNLHTHTLWSDGNDYPEMVAEWYKTNGYHFLALSDHNTLLAGQKWISVRTNAGGSVALEKYLKRFGSGWVEFRGDDEREQVRLKGLAEFRGKFEEDGRFLMLASEEISDRYKVAPVHLNATNPRELIKPQGGESVLEVIQNNVNAVLEQRKRTGQAMFPHINHPNFGWGITAEELMHVKGEQFFEVYNGHPSVFNDGDTNHVSVERMWDIVLAMRLGELGLDPMFGLATDDSHHYHKQEPKLSNTGRGWIMVRAPKLSAESLIAAMEAGDFYASTGVTLGEVRRSDGRLEVMVQKEPGIDYTIQFIGTRRGFDRRSEPIRLDNGEALRITHRYSTDIGAVLSESRGTSASYRLKGDELYVRAVVRSSRLKANSTAPGEHEMAWTQPIVGKPVVSGRGR